MRVLIVENDNKISRFLKRGLKEEGYFVDIVEDYTTAVELTKNGKYDVIIVGMKQEEGFDFCREIKKISSSVIITLTEDKETAIRKRVLELGVDDHLIKPLQFSQFINTLKSSVAKRCDQSLRFLTTADLKVNLTTHRVTRGTKEVILSPAEFNLLECLLRHKGTPVSGDVIEQYIRDDDTTIKVNVIAVYINLLRKKIDQGFDEKLIVTVRGKGYMIKS